MIASFLFWLFAPSYHWKFRTPGGATIRYRIKGFGQTAQNIWGEHMLFLDVARVNGWVLVSYPDEISDLVRGGV